MSVERSELPKWLAKQGAILMADTKTSGNETWLSPKPEGNG